MMNEYCFEDGKLIQKVNNKVTPIKNNRIAFLYDEDGDILLKHGNYDMVKDSQRIMISEFNKGARQFFVHNFASNGMMHREAVSKMTLIDFIVKEEHLEDINKVINISNYIGKFIKKYIDNSDPKQEQTNS